MSGEWNTSQVDCKLSVRCQCDHNVSDGICVPLCMVVAMNRNIIYNIKYMCYILLSVVVALEHFEHLLVSAIHLLSEAKV